MLHDDPNENSAVYLLTSDDKYAVCGTNFSPNQLFCRKYSAKFLLYGGDFWSRAGRRKRSSFPDMQIYDEPWTLQTPPYDDTQGIYKRTLKGAKLAESNSTTCEWIFQQLAAKNLNVSAVQRSIASIIRYSVGKKNYSIHYLTSQNRGLSGLKNIWTVIMTGTRPVVRYFEPWLTVIRLSPSQVKPSGTFFMSHPKFLYRWTYADPLILDRRVKIPMFRQMMKILVSISCVFINPPRLSAVWN